MILQPQRHGDAEITFTTPCPSLPRKGLRGGLSASVPLRLIFLLVVALFIFGCGKKLPPVAPESVVPEPVKEIKAVSRDGRLFVRFTRPTKNIDGSKITDLAGFRVMRRVVDDKGCKGCPEKFPVVYDIDISYPKGAVVEGDRISFPDNDLTPGTRYEYKVVPYNKDGYEGPEAPRVIFTWGAPAGKPQSITTKTGDKAVDLAWSPVETLVDGSPIIELAGYNIYRREEGDKYPLDSINSNPVKQTSFSDFGLSNGRSYRYTVKAVVRFNESLIEGPSSDEVAVTPKEAIVEELKGEPDAPLPVQR